MDGGDWLRFPIVWAETGRIGVLLVSPEMWRGLAYRYQAAGAPNGERAGYKWWYSWDGRCFVPHSRIDPPMHPNPTILGSLAWTAWWAWLPSAYIAVIVCALTQGPDVYPGGPPPIRGGEFLAAFALSICAFWAVVHWGRWLRRWPK